ncbi:hypothetical protein [Paludibacterium purpuratum]|uniref:Uncharacterized protein n=1 Tax=Paludibacterium purpuratum TaxID=1144873 RepID=A0A4R7BCQ5_9NEIS|nr:hypothetical protein [Paludibacterium purpuratum]TDR81516.1 hypothetical protein DFP86_103169 [Paludibacterium purpuratum]
MLRLITVAVLAVMIGGIGTPSMAADQNATMCTGDVQAPPAGLEEVQDPTLLAKAIGAPQQGKLCTGKVFKLAETGGNMVTVYRVWDASKPYTALGGWWSFSAPQGPRDAYRQENEICPAWSALNKVSHCTIKAGALIVVGPGQSAKCSDDLNYPTSPVNQVYIPNDAQNNQVFVENCQDDGDWPH